MHVVRSPTVVDVVLATKTILCFLPFLGGLEFARRDMINQSYIGSAHSYFQQLAT